MQTTHCDTKGRLYLRDEIRKRYGSHYAVTEAPGRIILLPIPDDPVASFRATMRKIRKIPLQKLRREIEEEALRQVAK